MNDGTTRREFLGALAAFSLFPLEQEKPDLILHNGHVVTMNAADPVAEAVAISQGRFFAVGKNAEVMNLATPSVQKIDLEGRTVLPGFIDAHSHPAEAGLSHLRMVDCDLRSISAIQAALRERAAKTPAGEWVLGFKYDDTKTTDARPLSIADLDAAVADHPVHIEHRGGHTVYANSLGLRKAGINEKTPDPPGGKIEHDPATGKLSGRVAESAQDFFDKVIPHNFTRDDHREGVKLIPRCSPRRESLRQPKRRAIRLIYALIKTPAIPAICFIARIVSLTTGSSMPWSKRVCAPGLATSGFASVR
jgi:predicted amidohydrolase YtcJ